MIFLTGDTHGTLDVQKFSLENFVDRNKLTSKDFMIISGDFGGVWYGKDFVKKYMEELKAQNIEIDKRYALLLDRDEATLSMYNQLGCTVLFIDGNHENFDALSKYKVEEWNGGKVQFIKPNIIHLMRGEVYTIDGLKFFVMGGGESIDKYRRVEGKSWWKEEMPSDEEYENGFANLEKVNWEVDYVITHSAPDNILYRINPTFQHNKLTNYLFVIDKQLQFKHWYFGHYHEDRKIDDQHTALYQNIVKID